MEDGVKLRISAVWKRRQGSRLERLAGLLDSAATRDEAAVAELARIEQMRRNGAEELHAVCSRFAAELNRFLTSGRITLDPEEFSASQFREVGANLFQLHARGRIVQIEIETPELPLSTEQFREPYILEGAVRLFNQERLDRNAVEEQQLFLCLRGTGCEWRFFDARTYRTGTFTPNYLAGMFERLV
jgi:hypothetical protein